MIYLFSTSSQKVKVLDQKLPPQAWGVERDHAIRLLRSRGHNSEASLLEDIAFDLCYGTNEYDDDFCVLYYQAPLDRYLVISREYYGCEEIKYFYRRIAEGLVELGHDVKFIILDLVNSDLESEPVSTPSIEVSLEAVNNALADAVELIKSRGPSSGVDRVHTAFHGYLKALAGEANLRINDDSSITDIFKLLRNSHPALIGRGPREKDISKVFKAMAVIVDTLNPIRNLASAAHPNEHMLDEPEAMLIINTVKTLLHYLNDRQRNQK